MAAFAGEVLSGLAGEVRTATTSEQYDLGGYTEVRARDFILAAFSTPLTAPTKMIKCTFVVGGGKLVRARYDEDMTKWLIAALREIGFTEDRSAAETFDSQGTYKQQHDTGQNLKYLIIYPRVTCSSVPTSSAANDTVDETSPEFLVVAADMAVFQDMVSSKVTSYAQKRKLLKLLQDKNEEFKTIEAKLMSGAQLSAAEQRIYDSNSGCDEEKITWLQLEIKTLIDAGQLNSREKAELTKQIEANVTATQVELETARAEKKLKKVEKLEAKLATLNGRKITVERISPIASDLRNSSEIQRVYLKVFPLRALEEKSRSMTLTLADLKLLEPKSDLEAEIKALEEAGRGWFSEEEDFLERCAAVENAAKARYRTLKAQNDSKKKTGGGSSSSSSGGGAKTGGSAWSTVKKTGSSSTAGASYSSSVKKTSTGASFAALGGEDSD